MESEQPCLKSFASGTCSSFQSRLMTRVRITRLRQSGGPAVNPSRVLRTPLDIRHPGPIHSVPGAEMLLADEGAIHGQECRLQVVCS